ncbi:MAG: GGDEF domain-containing protein [Eubacterium sp.]|nr:GGDEF domain-containing protein [Eubacterium sp.]
MKRFDRLKTIQLVILITLTAVALITILRDTDLYYLIAADPHVRLLCGLLWIVLAVSFGFLFYDFNSYSDLKRENMELDQAIYADALTGIANRYSVDVYIGQYLDRALPERMVCITLDLTSLARINHQSGHAGGDAAILAFSGILQRDAGEQCFVGRNGGNKFVVIFEDCTEKQTETWIEKVSGQVREYNSTHAEAPLICRAGIASCEADQVQSITELVALSDRRAARSDAGEPGRTADIGKA